MEIERKWLFDSVIAPEDSGAILIEQSDYTQGYLSVNPEVRIRSKHIYGTYKTDFKLCIKSKGNLERIEVEKPLSLEEYAHLIEVGGFEVKDEITKYIRVYKLGDFILTVGITDKGRDTEFIYGEIEFGTVEEAMAFNPPEWFGTEVTNDPSYKMCNYWARTRLNKEGIIK